MAHRTILTSPLLLTVIVRRSIIHIMTRPIKYNAFDWSDIEYGSPEYHRRWRLANNDHARAYKRAYDKEQYQKHPEREKARRLRWKLKNADKVKAHKKVRTALSSGKLVKQPCKTCGAVKVIAHHADYSKPLAVLWLCELHHKEWHRLNKVMNSFSKENT